LSASSGKGVRCAIYTRVSTDSGLDQDFNSLDAQYDAAQAYIRSQAHAGWTLVRRRYDDGGFSGGSTDRPALQQLLADIRSHKIDVIVVYKVDRLTRSLADFAKLVELFDAHQVSFVSVTQQFNTTTSMGRLTLNVLLSFAQFEREVTSERIRDKIGASKRKGLWVGGVVPLGYHAKDRKITVVEEEAEVVRYIFRRYLELGSLNLLLADLRTAGIKTKVRPLSTGRTIGGIPFTRGSLGYFLRNRFYVGEVSFKGEVFPGEQPTILDRKLFDAVQARLDQQRINQSKSRYATDAPLTGRIFDAFGKRMTPTYAIKKGVRYRYYVSSALIQGGASEAVEPKRLPAIEIETLIANAIRGRLQIDPETASDRDVILRHVFRVDVTPAALKISLPARSKDADPKDSADADLLIIHYRKTSSKQAREVLLHDSDKPARDGRPIRSETRINLVSAIARADTGSMNSCRALLRVSIR
jgi:DNA invertase Pin-like site-specific DNA recombinase